MRRTISDLRWNFSWCNKGMPLFLITLRKYSKCSRSTDIFHSKTPLDGSSSYHLKNSYRLIYALLYCRMSQQGEGLKAFSRSQNFVHSTEVSHLPFYAALCACTFFWTDRVTMVIANLQERVNNKFSFARVNPPSHKTG